MTIVTACLQTYKGGFYDAWRDISYRKDNGSVRKDHILSADQCIFLGIESSTAAVLPVRGDPPGGDVPAPVPALRGPGGACAVRGVLFHEPGRPGDRDLSLEGLPRRVRGRLPEKAGDRGDPVDADLDLLDQHPVLYSPVSGISAGPAVYPAVCGEPFDDAGSVSSGIQI